MLTEKYIIGCVFCQHFTQLSQKHGTNAPVGNLKPAVLYIGSNYHLRVCLENKFLCKILREDKVTRIQ